MHQCFSTAMVQPAQSQSYWHEVIGTSYFPLALTFRKEQGFQGQLSSWQMDELSLTRLESEALCYNRRRNHLVEGAEEHFLITIPEKQEVSFTQRGRSVRCGAGGWLLERSNEPYEFSYEKTNALWAAKVSGKALRQRVGSPDRFCGIGLDASSGSAALFVDFLRLLPLRLAQMTEREKQILSHQLLDLLAMALQSDQSVAQSSETAVQAAHLQRIQKFIQAHLGHSELTPQSIAEACGISTRYLHSIFKSTGRTVCQWIKEQRLQACYDALLRAAPLETIAQVAYRWGFSDQAHFCRAFKKQFGCSPSELRTRNRN